MKVTGQAVHERWTVVLAFTVIEVSIPSTLCLAWQNGQAGQEFAILRGLLDAILVYSERGKIERSGLRWSVWNSALQQRQRMHINAFLESIRVVKARLPTRAISECSYLTP